MVRSLLHLSALPPNTQLPPLVRILHCQTSEKFPILLVKARLTMEDHWADYGGVSRVCLGERVDARMTNERVSNANRVIPLCMCILPLYSNP